MAGTRRLSLIVALAVMVAACGSVQAPMAPYQAGHGGEVCAKVASDLQSTSSRWAGSMWAAGITGALLVIAGGLIGGGVASDPWYRRGAGVMVSALGASLGTFSGYSYARSDAASAATVAATNALTEKDDRAAYDRCADAKAKWLGSRIDSLQANALPKK